MTSGESWLEIPDGLPEPKLRDPDAFWASFRHLMTERRKRERELPPARTLAEFRRSCAVSQATLADRLGLEQGRLSRLERLSDLRLSALRAYVASLGGELVLMARLPDRDVQLNSVGPCPSQPRSSPPPPNDS